MIECGDSINHAMFLNCVMQRDEGESVPDFRQRARETALGLSAPTLIFDLLEMRWVDDVPETDNEEEN